MNTLIPVVVGTPVEIPIYNSKISQGGGTVSPILVGASPGASGTLLIQFRIAKGGVIRSFSSGNFVSAVSSETHDLLLGTPYSLYATATTSDGVVEVSI